MVAKLVVHAPDREQARMRMLRALEEFEIGGVTTLLGFHRALLEHPCFVAAETCHGVVESEELAARAAELSPALASAPPRTARATVARDRLVEVAGRRFSVRVREPEPPWRELARARAERGRRRRHRRRRPRRGRDADAGDGARRRGRGRRHCHRGPGARRDRGDEDGERGARAPRRVVRELSVTAGETVSTGQVVCVVVDE